MATCFMNLSCSEQCQLQLIGSSCAALQDSRQRGNCAAAGKLHQHGTFCADWDVTPIVARTSLCAVICGNCLA